MTENLIKLKPSELYEILAESNESPYRIRQIHKWIWGKSSNNINSFSDLPKGFREFMAKKYHIERAEISSVVHSVDGAIKFLIKFENLDQVEAVFIPEEGRNTVCVSSQVGCPLKCTFCATGSLGYRRNLGFFEILEQVRIVRDYVKTRITNVVFMGMGEPLLNYSEVVEAARILNDSSTFGVGSRKITISTSGIIPGIRKLENEPEQFKLAVSLNSAVQGKREKLMPVAKKFPLEELKKVLMEYYEKKRRWITFEYILIPEVNESHEDLEALIDYTNAIPSKLNLIPYNPHPYATFRAPTDQEIEYFLKKLRRYIKRAVTLRKSKGQDIQGACGQLAYFVKSKE